MGDFLAPAKNWFNNELEDSRRQTMFTVFVVSDATGDTAQRMVRAGLVQFQDAPVRVVRRHISARRDRSMP